MVEYVDPAMVCYMDIAPKRRPKMNLLEAMVYVSEMSYKSPAPESYKWGAKWWRLHAKESYSSSGCMAAYRSQMSIYRDMKSRPNHYANKPANVSDWLWSKINNG